MQKICTITPYRFDGKYIIVLDSQWVEVLGISTFDVIIVDGRLRIQTMEVIHNEFTRGQSRKA